VAIELGHQLLSYFFLFVAFYFNREAANIDSLDVVGEAFFGLGDESILIKLKDPSLDFITFYYEWQVVGYEN
jgi:hypothetical protein